MGSKIIPGSACWKSLNAVTAAGAGSVLYVDGLLSRWALRVDLNGNATGVVVQLKGAILSSSSEAHSGTTVGPFVPLTTWNLQAPLSCDDTVFITDKPCNAVLAEVTSISSTGTTVTAYVAGTL